MRVYIAGAPSGELKLSGKQKLDELEEDDQIFEIPNRLLSYYLIQTRTFCYAQVFEWIVEEHRGLGYTTRSEEAE